MNWFISIIIGAIAGWLAGVVMHSKGGFIRNAVLGIVGGVVGSAVLGVFGISGSGFVGTILVSAVGACIIIWLVKAIIK